MRITARQYAQTLYDLTDGKSNSEVEKSVADFARYIYRNRKLKLAGKIIEHFSRIYNSENGIVEAEVVTREKISAETEKKAKHFIKEKFGAKEVVLRNTVDENIKGGIIMKVGDEVVDGSVRGKLGELKKVLISN
jgi:F-type H+-transporting ATPase subunit delta